MIAPRIFNVMRQRVVTSLIAALVVCCNAASGQGFGGGSDPSPDGERPKTTRIDLFEFLNSATDVLLEQFERRPAEPTVDDPRWDGYGSPRETVMTFVEAMNHVALGRDEAWPRARDAMPGGGGGDEASGPDDDLRETARHLLGVFDRLPEISSGSIPGREAVRSRDVRRWELFPRGIETDWAYRALDGGPGGSIVLVADDDGRWRFDKTTVRDAGELLSNLRSIPPRKRLSRKGDLVKSVFEPTLFESDPGDWVFFLVVVAVGVGIAWFVVKVLRRLADAVRRRGDGLLMPLVNGSIVPAAVFVVTLAVAIGSSRLHFHPTLENLRTGLIEASLLLSVVFLGVAVIEMLTMGTRRALGGGDDPYARMVTTMVRRALRLVAGCVLALFLIQNVLHWDITAMLGGFAILALALSLAAQDAVKNLFGAFTIFATRPFITGDWIRFDGQIGTVEDVSMQATKIRLLSGEIYSVPNMRFIDTAVENLAQRQYLRRVMNVAVTYDTPPEKIDQGMRILNDILTDESIVDRGRCDLDEYPPKIAFDKFESDYLNLRVDYWYLMSTDEGEMQRTTERGWFSYLEHATEVNREVLRRFNEAGIEFAFPTQTLHVNADEVPTSRAIGAA